MNTLKTILIATLLIGGIYLYLNWRWTVTEAEFERYEQQDIEYLQSQLTIN